MEPFTLTIPEFCRLHGISRGTYYNLVAQGSGPREMRVGSRVLITVESAAEWRKAMERRAEDDEANKADAVMGGGE
jgi:predicted DNA-binding transcriptional regulator AlpA